MGEDAPEAERDAAFATWKQKAIPAWQQWYETIAPYGDRDRLGAAPKKAPK